jgi:hypothetical protein
MKSHQRLHRVGFVVLGAVLSVAFPPLGVGQAEKAQPQTSQPPVDYERDIASRKKTLLSESSDLDEIAKSLRPLDSEAALRISRKATDGVMELDATLWFLNVYDNMQCEADREVAKATLKNRLAFYSHLLDIEADQVAGNLAFATLPATAQAGQRIKDDLRAAKNKLDEIAASLP